MEQYLQKSVLSGVLNGLGVRVLLMAAGAGWFVWLWGVSVPALLAGIALGLLLQLALNGWRRHAAEEREDAARRQLGGEMALENLLLLPTCQAHEQAARLLSMRYPLTVRQVTEEGALCDYGPERLLVMCLQRPKGCDATCMDAVALQRACRTVHADRGVLCLTCAADDKLAAYVETCPVPIRIVPRSVLMELAGRAAPATDEQLMDLKRRRNRRTAVGSLSRMLLHPAKAQRYMMYGIGLMLMYIVTGMRYYPIPGAVCMGLAALCRCNRVNMDGL